MDRYVLLRHGKRVNKAHPIKVLDGPAGLRPLTSELGWRVFREMVTPACPIDVAKKLGVHEQKVYYYIRKFRKAGLIREVQREQRHGMVARFYQARDVCLGLVADKKHFENVQIPVAPAFRSLEPFVSGGKLNCRIVVGSPDPHGPYKTRASDSCCAIDLALFLGSFTDGKIAPNYKLDVEVRPKDMRGNLVVIGGPTVNMVADKLNRHLPIQIERGDEISMFSKLSGKRYFDEEIGFVCLARNPFSPRSKVLVLVGKRFQGTRSAVIAFIRHMDEVLAGNRFSRGVQARVVRGFDMDGDGIIDAVEFLE